MEEEMMSNLNEKPHLIYGAKVFKDGDQYCCLYGENLQEGIAEFGNTPDLACENFDRLWRYGESKSPVVKAKITEESLREALGKKVPEEKELTCIRIAFNDSKILQLMYEVIDANCTSPQIHLIENAMVEKLKKAGIDIFSVERPASESVDDTVSVSEIENT
jgi:hypothetical protein